MQLDILHGLEYCERRHRLMDAPDSRAHIETIGTDAGLGDSFSHAAMAAGVAIMVSNSIGVKRPSAA